MRYAQITYNLRSRMQRVMLDEGNDESLGGQASENEQDHLSEHSESDAEYESPDDSENASLLERLNKSQARGRPISTLRGKNGFKWTTNTPSRRSGTQSKMLLYLMLYLSIASIYLFSPSHTHIHLRASFLFHWPDPFSSALCVLFVYLFYSISKNVSTTYNLYMFSFIRY